MKLLILILSILLAAPSFSFAQEGWKCGNKVVYKGETQAQVLSKCGQPVSSSVGATYTRGTYQSQSQRYRRGYSTSSGQFQSTSVDSESWIYEESYDLMYEYVFVCGKLRNVNYVGKK